MRRWMIGIATVMTVAGCGGLEVAGIVRDERTGEPLPGATVTIGEESTRTDVGGGYELEVDADDDEPMHVYVSKEGYASHSGLVTMSEDEDRVVHDLELESRAEEQRTGTTDRQPQEQPRRQATEQRPRVIDADGRELDLDDAETIIIVPRRDAQQPQEPQRYEGKIELRPAEQQQPPAGEEPRGEEAQETDEERRRVEEEWRREDERREREDKGPR